MTITNCEFFGNGSLSSVAVIHVFFPDGFDIYNILLEGNVFKDNSSQKGYAVVAITKENDSFTSD